MRDYKRKLLKVIDTVSFWRDPQYYCPCCETRLYRWKRGEFEKHPELCDVNRYKKITYDTLCPVCNSLQRHRIIIEYMKNSDMDLHHMRILYFAVEGSVKQWLDRHHIGFVSADLYGDADLQIDMEDTGLPNSSYDLIICNHVLEHVNDYRRALKELRRILSDEGILLCSFPIDVRYETVYEDFIVVSEAERIKCFGQADHLRIFGRDSREILENAGFRVTTIDEEIELSEKILPLPGPADYDLPVVFVCRPKM